MSTAPSLSASREVTLSQGTLRYRDSGSGRPIVFVHGLLVNGDLWRHVVPPLSRHARCIVPDLPLGAHTRPLRPDADLSPLGLAGLIAEILSTLDLHDVILVGSDTGGALCQLVIAHHPERMTGLILTNCDAFENFLPPLLRPFQYGARLFGPGFVAALALALRPRTAQRLFVGTVAHRSMNPEILDSYCAPLGREPGVRRDVTKVLQGISNRYTLDAARAFPGFAHPVLLVWGLDDLFFPVRFAERLHRAFPHATLERVARSRTFVAEDQPDLLARLVIDFVHGRVPDYP